MIWPHVVLCDVYVLRSEDPLQSGPGPPQMHVGIPAETEGLPKSLWDNGAAPSNKSRVHARKFPGAWGTPTQTIKSLQSIFLFWPCKPFWDFNCWDCENTNNGNALTKSSDIKSRVAHTPVFMCVSDYRVNDIRDKDWEGAQCSAPALEGESRRSAL